MKKYNVWVIVEEIDEAKDERGKDVSCRKLISLKTQERADKFARDISIEDMLEEFNEWSY